jgi:16S rRNA (guanine(966)-N(2))-methyltransferase RsmD
MVAGSWVGRQNIQVLEPLMSPAKRKSSAAGSRPQGSSAPAGVRIIGGRLRGRKLHYSVDRRTRPMKDRVREAIFNILGPAVREKHVLDLFAGTGALGLEALSRGARGATFIEQHYPTAEALRASAAELEVASVSEVVSASVFMWFRRRPELPSTPWLVFCSPPYEFYVARTSEMLDLIGGLLRLAPAESLFVVESDARFDMGLLPDPAAWDQRAYPPAVVGIYRK